MSRASTALSALLVAASVGGCQLLLPAEDDDGRATSTGGAGSTSGKTTGKSSSVSASSTSGSTMTAATTTGGGSTSASTTSSGPSTAVSSGSGATTCKPSVLGCDGLTALALPKLCPTDVVCDMNAACTQYCSAMFSLCPEQYLTPFVCCQVCGHIQAQGEGTQCCHVDALNDLAAGSGTATSCTVAGPFGSDTMSTAGQCGSQATNLCDIYEAACGPQAATCGKAACKSYLAMRTAVTYSAGTDPNATLSRLMDLLLGSDADKCNLAAAEFCIE